jgi:enamine deaminase RidA (YjgF/YER057c/UK114 family)
MLKLVKHAHKSVRRMLMLVQEALVFVDCLARWQPTLFLEFTMSTITRIDPGARMSDAVIHGDTIYLAGQVAGEAKGKSTREQTIDVLAQIDALLNAVWDAWVDKANPTARATVEARLAAPAYLIEIVCIAGR